MLSFRLVTTQNGYIPAATIESTTPGGGAVCIVSVVNAGVFAQFKSAPGDQFPHKGGLDWGEEIYMAPQARRMVNVAGVRFRSAIAGVPAQVSAELYEPGIDAVPTDLTAFAGALAFDPNPPAGGVVYNEALVTLAASTARVITLGNALNLSPPVWQGSALLCVRFFTQGGLEIALQTSIDGTPGNRRAIGYWENATASFTEFVTLPGLGVNSLTITNKKNYSIDHAVTIALVNAGGAGFISGGSAGSGGGGALTPV